MFVTCQHPAVEGTAEIPERSLDHYRSKGWAPVDETAPPTDDLTCPHRCGRSYKTDQGLQKHLADKHSEPPVPDGSDTTTEPDQTMEDDD